MREKKKERRKSNGKRKVSRQADKLNNNLRGIRKFVGY